MVCRNRVMRRILGSPRLTEASWPRSTARASRCGLRETPRRARRALLPERRQIRDAEGLAAHVGRRPVLDPQAPDRVAAVIAEEVPPPRLRDGSAPVDEPAGDRAAAVVTVDVDREDEPSLRRRRFLLLEDVALVDVPAVVDELGELRA